MAQFVEHLTLDFSSGDDLTVHGIEPNVGLWADSLGFSLSLSLCPSLSCTRVHALSRKKIKIKKIYIVIEACWGNSKIITEGTKEILNKK